jgi:hypothetical protein
VLAPELRRLAGQVADIGKHVGAIDVTTAQAGNGTAATAISTFVASARSDASDIGRVVGQDADHVSAASTVYSGVDDASAGAYGRLMDSAGTMP